MSFLTKVITDTSPDFGDNPQIVTENGQPSSVDVDNLVSNTGYWTKAEIWQNGVLNDTSEVESFQTLPAGTITLTHQSSVRSGSNYIVTYTYTSTYALSSSVLICGSSISSQGLIAGNTITFTVSGLVPGDAYMSQITTIDMYGESAQTSITLIMPVVNEVSITGTTTTSSTVVCELDYTIDGGFAQGWVDYWDENADPSTDQPQGHATFTDGADSCTITGLTDGTTYQLRATIYYGGYVNYVVSSVVTATTVADYSTKYFTIKNTGSNSVIVNIVSDSGVAVDTIYFSKDDGETWDSVTTNSSSTRQVSSIEPDSEILFKHTGAMYGRHFGLLCSSGSTMVHLHGNIASLCFGDNFTGTQTMPQNAFRGLFNSISNIINISGIYAGHLRFSSFTRISTNGITAMFDGCANLRYAPDFSTITEIGYEGMRNAFRGATQLVNPPHFGSLTTISSNGMYGTFEGCTALTTPPDFSTVTNISGTGNELGRTFYGCTRLATPPDLSGITAVSNSGMSLMFYNCTALTTSPDLSSLTSVSYWGMRYMFEGCTALTTPPDLSNVTSIQTYAFERMFYGCTDLTYAPDFGGITSIPEGGMKLMFNGCTALTTVPDMSNVTSIGDDGLYYAFIDCDSITSPPDLSNVTSVGNNGLDRAFANCDALEAGPDLRNVTTVGTLGLKQMMMNCSSLTEAYAPDIVWDTTKTNEWLYGVAASGTLYVPTEAVSDTIPDNVSGCPSGWEKEILN